MEKIVFKWGEKSGVGRKNKNVQFYKSFTYNGDEYSLFDCVYVQQIGHCETHIGKIVRIYQTEHEKKVRLVWFFRPGEIRNFLNRYEPSWNEIFLASGVGIGLANDSLLESIVKKCNVVCASSDMRNPRPSEWESRKADYIFYYTFDVGTCTILEKFPNEIDGREVQCFFNRHGCKAVGSVPFNNIMTDQIRKPKRLNTLETDAVNETKMVNSIAATEQQILTTEKGSCLRPPFPTNTDVAVSNQAYGSGKNVVYCNYSLSPSSSRPAKKKKLLLDEEEDAMPGIASSRGARDGPKFFEVNKKPDPVRNNWFEQIPWEEQLQRALVDEVLIALENLDPSFSSSEVEDLVFQTLNEMVGAKMMQQSTFSRPLYGTALVIFKSKEAADFAISELQNRCLILADGRPIIARKVTHLAPQKNPSFCGHVTTERLRYRRLLSADMRNAVSTAHCSQPNTIEYEMAANWCLLQEISDRYLSELQKMHVKETENAMNLLKSKEK